MNGNTAEDLSETSLSAAVRSVEVEEDGAPLKSPERRKRNRSRARTISVRRLSKTELKRGQMLYPETDYWKPRNRVSCKYHLYIDVNPEKGSIKMNFPDVEVWEMAETCALDIADRGGITLEDVGEIMNLTRERVRQVETTGLAKLQALVEDMEILRQYFE